jgi:hypothetical protein
MITNRELKGWYDELNVEYFRGRLPDIPVRFGRITRGRGTRLWAASGFHARTYFQRPAGRHVKLEAVEIRLSPWIRKDWRRYAWITLVHEMIHVELGYRPDCKSSKGPFAKRIRQLTRRGILDAAV